MSYTAIITGEGHWPAMPTPAGKPTYTYRNGSIYYGETKVIEQWTGDREGILAMIAKANAADELAIAMRWATADILAVTDNFPEESAGALENTVGKFRSLLTAYSTTFWAQDPTTNVAGAKREPKADADGWIPWTGGKCPVPPETMVEYRCRDGYIATFPANFLRWNHHNDRTDIIAYRIAGGA